MKERLTQAAIVAIPALLASAFVLTVFADTGAVLYALPRALASAVLLALAAQLISIALTRSLSLGTFIATGLLIAVVEVRFGLIMLALLVAKLYAARVGRSLDIIGPVGILVGLLFLVSATRAVTSEGFVIEDLMERSNGDGAPHASDPDVYVILLDGYPRSDTLAELGYDNTWFERELEDRGFNVASESTSSYTYTGLTLASMFNVAHLPDIPGLYPAPDSHVAQTRALVDAINHNPVLETFEQRGYWTVSAGLTEVRGALRAVDEYLDGGEIRLWERQVMQRTAVWPLLCERLVIPQHRSLVNSTFDQIEATADTKRDAPVFMFAHVMSPHTPIVFDATGAPADPDDDCGAQFHIDAGAIGLEPDEFGSLLGDQIQYLNHRTLDAVDAILDQQGDAVVVVLSDHGARFTQDPTDEWFRPFFAAHTSLPSRIYTETARPIDVFPALFQAYFDESVSPAPVRRFTSIFSTNYPLIIEPRDTAGGS